MIDVMDSKFDAGPSKLLQCMEPNCGKTFTRKDHLVRHAANHTSPSHHCPICNRPFQRLDLLQRHEKRNTCSSDDNEIRKRKRSTSGYTGDEQKVSIETSIPTGTLIPTNIFASEMYPPDPTPTFLSEITVDGVVAGSLADPSALLNNWTDWGFGIWPPENWEPLLHDTLAPALDEMSFDLEMPWNIDAIPRIKESAERRPDSSVSLGLVSRLKRAYPEADFSLDCLSQSLDKYWSEVAPLFPFIHRGTFDVDTSPAELVITMAIVGSVHLDQAPIPDLPRGGRQGLRALVKKIRGSLIQHASIDMANSVMQAFCLCHVHDVWYATSESLYVAQLTWPVMVAHTRKKGVGVVGRTETEGLGELAWNAWAKDEERRRAAYCILLVDTQISVFWSQHPSRQLSVFAHNLNLPCPKTQWEAPTAVEWFRIHEKNQPPSSTPITKKPRAGYLPGLHPEFQVHVVSEGYSSALLSALAGDEHLPFRMDLDNTLSAELLLTGLMGIAWDCRTRGGMGIRFRDGTKHWRSIVLDAVIKLRAAYEAGVALLQATHETRAMRDNFSISIVSILSDIPMLQVAAGATIVCGANIGPRQYADAKRRLRLWSKTTDAWTCLWQSARFLRETLHREWGIYSGWAVFLATLVCWAYSWTGDRGDRLSPHASSLPSQIQQSNHLLDQILASPTRLDNIDVGITDLIVIVADKLEHVGYDSEGAGEVEVESSSLLWRLVGNGKGGRRN